MYKVIHYHHKNHNHHRHMIMMMIIINDDHHMIINIWSFDHDQAESMTLETMRGDRSTSNHSSFFPEQGKTFTLLELRDGNSV